MGDGNFLYVADYATVSAPLRATIAPMTASDVVLKRLKDAGIRPADLARALGVTPQMAGQMLKGKRGVPIWHLDAIANTLGCEVSEIFRGTGAADGVKESQPPTLQRDAYGDSVPFPADLAADLSQIALTFYKCYEQVSGIAGKFAAIAGRQAPTPRTARSGGAHRAGKGRGRDDRAPKRRKAG